jgi:hypothetical protein
VPRVFDPRLWSSKTSTKEVSPPTCEVSGRCCPNDGATEQIIRRDFQLENKRRFFETGVWRFNGNKIPIKSIVNIGELFMGKPLKILYNMYEYIEDLFRNPQEARLFFAQAYLAYKREGLY